jgi:hypothetical protein
MEKAGIPDIQESRGPVPYRTFFSFCLIIQVYEERYEQEGKKECIPVKYPDTFLCYRPYPFTGMEDLSYDPTSHNLYFNHRRGVWLFYVQHQYPDVTWVRKEDWDYKTIALEGSSYLKLPRVLQWFSGNIGFHHIHHLSPKIPNYNLQKCHEENEMFSNIKPVTFVPSIKTISLKLWDEHREQLISFRKLRRSLKFNNI